MTLRLEDLQPDALVQGLVGREAVRVVTAEMLGDMACKVVFRGQDGALGEQLLFRSNEADLELVGGGRKWSFSGSGDLFRLVSEATRIELAYLFDPYVAVSSSTIDPRRLSAKMSARGADLSTSASLLRMEDHGLRDRMLIVTAR